MADDPKCENEAEGGESGETGETERALTEARETYFRLHGDVTASPEDRRAADLRMWAAFGAKIDAEAGSVRPMRLAPTAAAEALLEVARHAEALSKALGGLPPQLRVLIDSGEAWENRISRLGLLADMAGKAAAEARASGGHDVRGRPAKNQAAAVATWAARDFEARTGRRAAISVDPVTGKAGGEFLAFVAEAFDRIGISASPEAAARAAIKALKAKEKTPRKGRH